MTIRRFAAFAVLGSVVALGAADTPINLLPVDRFAPVVMHGRISAARGWWMRDDPRYDCTCRDRRYLSGEKCFTLDCKDGVFTIRFLDPLPAGYEKARRPICFAAAAAWPPPPAPEYRTTGMILADRGGVTLDNGIELAASAEWRTIDRRSREPFRQFRFFPAAGGRYSFAEFRCEAVYPEVGGAIALPGGGKLTRFLLPRDASYVMRWSIALWRGWLWKLTGVALPVETVDVVKPTPGAFAAVKGETAPGGWRLTVDSEGIALVYGDELAVEPALFDYLRLKLDCNFYHHTFKKLPPDGSCRELPAIRREAKPKFRTYTGDAGTPALLGGVHRELLYTFNAADYYHQHAPTSDHILNIVLPMELYYKTHPEYFMMDPSGRRVAGYDIFRNDPCLSNHEVRKIMIRNAIDYAKAQTSARLLDVNLADDHVFCHCPECRQLDAGTSGDSDAVSLFDNELAAALAKELPGMIVNRSAYVTRRTPPKRIRNVPDNVILNYCAGHDTLPCTLHVDCEINRRGYAEIEEWAKIFDRSRIAFMIYRDVRPIHHLKMIERLNRYGDYGLYSFMWKGLSPAVWFVTSRWNLGEDPEKLVEEFDHAYYGAGGKYVHEINLLVEKYAENYKHTEEELKFTGRRHLCIWGGSLESRTLLERATFDKIYALFDKAFAAARGDRGSSYRIALELRFYLAEDLLRYNILSCRSDEELAAFAKRLARLIRLADCYRGDFASVMYLDKARDFFAAVTGIAIPDTGRFWTEEPELRKFLADPVRALRQRVEKIPTGFYFAPGALRSTTLPLEYGYRCPPRLAVTLTRPSLGNAELAAVVNFDEAPAGAVQLSLEGLDDDKKGASRMRVSANGKTVFEGPVAFPETMWGRMGFTIPAGVLRKGENVITVANVTPDNPSRSARFTDPAEAAKDHQWGWFMISELCLMDLDGDFARFAAGGDAELWKQQRNKENLPAGQVKCADGKVELAGSDAAWTGIVAFRAHPLRKVAVTPRGRVRMSFRAAGEGEVRARLLCYRDYSVGPEKKPVIDRRGHRDQTDHFINRAQTVKLEASPKLFLLEFDLHPAIGFVVPELCVKGRGHATISEFRMEVLPPAAR